MNSFDQPLFITGLPRSGTSLTAGLFTTLGVWCGQTVAGGPSNPKGFFEHTAIREQVVKGILKALQADPLGVRTLPASGSIIHPQFENGLSLADKIHTLVRAEGYDDQLPWLFKDAKLTLLWRTFHHAFPHARWIIVRRPEQDFIESCLRTHFMRQHSADPDFWRQFAREYNLRLDQLRATIPNTYELHSNALVQGDFDGFTSICKLLNIPLDLNKVKSFIEPNHWTQTSTPWQTLLSKLSLPAHRPTVYIAGTGPSLKDIDTSRLDPSKQIIITTNNAHLAFPKGVTISHHSDYAWWRSNGSKFLSTFNGQAITTAALGHNRPQYPDQVLKLPFNGTQVFGGAWGTLSGMNSGQQALVMAHWFLPQTIVLLGMDHHRNAKGQAHWTTDSDTRDDSRQDAMWLGGMKWWQSFVDHRSSEWSALGQTSDLPQVLNASPSSAITQFRKIDDITPYL